MDLIVVAGAIANKCHSGGESWVRLSWIRGLQNLGFRVYFLEQIDAAACTDAAGSPAPVATSENRRYFDDVAAAFGLRDSAALICNDTGETFGATYDDIRHVCESASLLINISGHLRRHDLLDCFTTKVYVDIDPGFTQIWHAQGIPGGRILEHDHYFTIAENINQPGCSIPTGGLAWLPIRQPVVLSDWPVCKSQTSDRFTTIANWRGPYGAIEYDGKLLGLKVHEFRRFIELPSHVPARFELALNIHPADARDLVLLERNGWHVESPRCVASDPQAFRTYVQRSDAEFSVAQGMYAATGSGWFSDRSVRYLASGKPVLVQDTGLSPHLPVGEGLLVFSTMHEAIAGARAIMDDYGRHAAGARRIAEECFDSNLVLPQLLEQVGVKV